MAEEIIARKLAVVQGRLAEHTTWLRDLESGLATVEEALGVLVIPRTPPHRSNYEYVVEIEPVLGVPETVKLTARSDEQAMKKAREKARFPIPATAKILSKVESNPQRYWVVIYRTPIELRWRREYYPTREEARTRKELLTGFDYEARYFPAGFSSPQVRRLGVPRTDVERVMAHYGVSRETAEKLIEEVGAKALLPPRGLRVRIPEGYEELSSPSRWVLEMYPLDVLAWRRSLVELAGKPLTASEHRLVSSYDDYLRRKGYLTSRQIEVLGEIARRHEVELPAIPEVR